MLIPAEATRTFRLVGGGGDGHHPDWANIYNRAAIRLNPHDAGGKVTAKDVALATKIQAISWVG